MRSRWVVGVSLVFLGCSPFTSRSSAAPVAGTGSDAPVATIGGEPAPTPAPTPAAGDDRDGDKIADAGDRCPDAAETLNGVEDEDGCPDAAAGAKVEEPRGTTPTSGTQAAADVAIGGVEFDEKKAEVTAGRQAELDRAVAILKQSALVRVAIVGHTQASENRKLGLERAESVRDYLVDAGIDGARLEVRNVGADQPLGGDAARDRRVEFKVLPQ
ncbi:MAG: OmpA family protein [Myxococcales bacterium]|nr:OmpA family protein [Myxococcales bacterium]